MFQIMALVPAHDSYIDMSNNGVVPALDSYIDMSNNGIGAFS